MVYADSHKNMMMMMLNDDRVGWCAKAPPCLVARINFSSVTYMCRAQIPTDDDDDGGCGDGFHQEEQHIITAQQNLPFNKVYVAQ